MSWIVLEVLVLGVLVAANGLFAMSELAVVSSRRIRLLQRAERGDRRARIALDLTEAQGQFLSTVQIWITLIGILAGAFSGATIADELAEILNRSSAVQGFGEVIAVAAVVMVVSFLSLVFGELVPKRIALENPEQIASMVAPGMRFVSHLAGPVCWDA